MNRILTVSALVAGFLVPAAAATAATAAPQISGYHALGTISPYGHRPGPARTGGLCLTALADAPGQQVWMETCSPNYNLQQWSASSALGNLDVHLAKWPLLCLSGIGNYESVLVLVDCDERLRVVAHGLYITGIGNEGNGIQSASSRKWLSSNRRGQISGPAKWQKGNSFLQELLNRGYNQGWVFNGGWDKIEVSTGDAISGHRAVTGYDSTGRINAQGSKMCLETRYLEPGHIVDWSSCIAGDARQIWSAQVIAGTMIIFLTANPGICIDGGPHAGEYVYTFDCSGSIKPTSGLLLYGKTTEGAVNAIVSALTGRVITYDGGSGPARWEKGRGFITRTLFGLKKGQAVVFGPPGWLKVIVA